MKLEQKFSAFPWYNEVHSQLQRSFTFNSEKDVEDALESFVEPMKSELDNILKEYDTNKAEALLNVVKDCLLYLHFQDILLKDGFQDSKYLYLKVLSCFLDLCIVLSSHLASSRMDFAFQHLYLCSKSDVVIMYDVLLQCQLIKKSYAELCCPILRQVLRSSVNRNLEPEQFMKFILLSRLWKVFCKKAEKARVKALIAKMIVPLDLPEFLSSFPVPEISWASINVKKKKIAAYFLCNKFPKNVLMDVKQILCNETFANVDKVTGYVPVDPPSDMDGNEPLFCIDTGFVAESQSDYRSEESHHHLPNDSDDANECQDLPHFGRPLNSAHEVPFSTVEENFHIPDENMLVLDSTRNIDDDDHLEDDSISARKKSGEQLDNASFNLRFSLSPDGIQCGTKMSKSSNEVRVDEDSSDSLEVSSSEETKSNSLCNTNNSRETKCIDMTDSKSNSLPSQNEVCSEISESSEADEESTTRNQTNSKSSKKERKRIIMNDDSFLNISDVVQINDKSVGDLMNVSSISANERSFSSETLTKEAFERCKTWAQELQPETDSEDCINSCDSSSSENGSQNQHGNCSKMTISPSSSSIVEKVEKNYPLSASPKKQHKKTPVIAEGDNQQTINLKPIEEVSTFVKCGLVCEMFVDAESESKNSSDSCSEEQKLQPATDSKKCINSCGSSSKNDKCQNKNGDGPKMTISSPSSVIVKKVGKNSPFSTSPKKQQCNKAPVITEDDKQQTIIVKPTHKVSAFEKCDLVREMFADIESESKNSSDSCSEESDSKNAKSDLVDPSELLGASYVVDMDSVASDNKNKEVIETEKNLDIDDNHEDECRYVKCLYPGQNLPTKQTMPHTKSKRLSGSNKSQTKEIEDEYSSQNSFIGLASPTLSRRSSKLNGVKKASTNKAEDRNDSPNRKRVKLEESVSKIMRAKTISVSSPARELRSAVPKKTRVSNLPPKKSLCQTPVKVTSVNVKDTRKSLRKSPTPSKVTQSNNNQSDSEFHSPDTSDCEMSEFDSPSTMFGKKKLPCHSELGYGLRKLRVNLAKNNATFNLENKDTPASDKSLLPNLRNVSEMLSQKKTGSSKSQPCSRGSARKGSPSSKKIPSSPLGKDKSDCESSPRTLRSPAKKYNLRTRSSKTPWKKRSP